MRSFRSAVDFARSSSRECLRRCQRHGLLPLTPGNVEGSAEQHEAKFDREILEYRLFREFCKTPMETDGSACPLDNPNGGRHSDKVRLRRNRSVSYSDSLQQAHSRTQKNADEAAEEAVVNAEVPASGNYAPTLKTRSQKFASSFRRLSRKLRQCDIVLLDGSQATFSVDPSSKAQTLLDLTCEFLSINERQYFGLCYKDAITGAFEWLYNEKQLGKQLDGSATSWKLDFAVKFYPSRPECLSDASARNCLALQVRQCLVAGRLPCSVIGYALLGSYILQSELGDRRKVIGDNGETSATASVQDPSFCPPEMLPKVSRLARRLHAHHTGLPSRDAERLLLANARRLAAYGLDVHEARCVEAADDGRQRKEVGEGENDVLVGVCSDGLVLMRPDGLLRLARLTWPRIVALTRGGCEVRVTLRRVGQAASAASATATLRLLCGSGQLAKRLWRSAVEHHGFFRLKPCNSSARQRIHSGTVRMSRSCYSGNKGFASLRLDDALHGDGVRAGGGASLQRSASLPPWQRRAVSLNRVTEIRSGPATLVKPEDLDDDIAICQPASMAADSFNVNNISNYYQETGEEEHSDDNVDDEEPDEANHGMMYEYKDTASKDQWQTEDDDGFMESPAMEMPAAGASTSTSNRRFQYNSTSSRYDSSSTDLYQEHDHRRQSNFTSLSPVYRQPPSGEETPSQHADCSSYEDRRPVFNRSSEDDEVVPLSQTLSTDSNHRQSTANVTISDANAPTLHYNK